MALINFPQAPTVSSIYAPKDSVAQLNYMNQSNSQALNNLLNLGSKIHDYSLSRDQAGLMENPDVDPNTKATQIAALESRKINSSDPSMIWRWKTQMDQQAAEAEKNRLATREANAAIKEADLKNFGNKATMILSRDLPSDLGSLRSEEKEIENVILEGQKLGYDVSPLLERQKELKGLSEDIRFEDMEKKFNEEKEKKRIETEKQVKARTKALIEEYIARTEDIIDKDEFNQTIDELKKMAEANGLRAEFDKKWPEKRKKSRTNRTYAEEQEFDVLVNKEKNNRLDKKMTERLKELRKLKPYKG